MPVAIVFYDVVLSIHVMAVVAAFGVWFAYPLLVVRGDAAAHRAQVRVARMVVNPAGTLALLAGVYLASDRSYWSEVWVSVPLVILIVLLGITGAYFIPRQERLAELAEAGARARVRCARGPGGARRLRGRRRSWWWRSSSWSPSPDGAGLSRAGRSGRAGCRA